MYLSRYNELSIIHAKEYFVPFIKDVYPDGHKFMQDNDPKHTSRHAQAFFAENSINWWKTPPERPDANRLKTCGMNRR